MINKFIIQKLYSVCYGAATEELRTLEEQEVKRLNLRTMLVQGEQSGLADYHYDTFIAELDKNNLSNGKE